MAVYTVDLDRHDENGGRSRVVEKRNRTWRCLGFPRSLLDAVQDRDEDDRSGVYVLWGYKAGHSKPYIYVGQSDEAFKRLETHERTGDKEYWEHTVVFTSKDQGLHTTHVKYLEAELVRLARHSNRVELKNATNPRTAPLSGAVLDEVKEYFSDLLDCLAVIGVDFFEPTQYETAEKIPQTKSHKSSSSATNTPISPEKNHTSEHEYSLADGDVLSIRSKGIVAYGYENGDKFVVKAGSQAVKNETPSARNNPKFKHIPSLRKKLVRKGVLKDADIELAFAKDFSFDSPTAASCAVLGSSSNGLATWKDENGRSLGEIRSTNILTDDTNDETIHIDPLTETPHYLFLRHKGIEARGYVSEEGFVVTRGSEAVGDRDVTNSIPRSSRKLRQELITRSVLKREGSVYVLTEDCDLKSPSRAASVLLGASYNGNKYWIDENKRSLGEIQKS